MSKRSIHKVRHYQPAISFKAKVWVGRGWDPTKFSLEEFKASLALGPAPVFEEVPEFLLSETLKSSIDNDHVHSEDCAH